MNFTRLFIMNAVMNECQMNYLGSACSFVWLADRLVVGISSAHDKFTKEIIELVFVNGDNSHEFSNENYG